MINFLKWLFTFSKVNNEAELIDGRMPGLLASPIDHRDVNAKDILGAINLAPLPEEYRIPYLLPVKDQTTTPHCVGYSCSTIKDEKERREKNDITFDPDWIYYECKKIDGIPNFQGTYFRTGLKILADLGAKPINGGDPTPYRIGGYAKVDTDMESLKRAIFQWGVILAGFHLYPGSWNSARIKKGSNIVGAHAVALIGWNKDYIIGQNSYGTDWGDKGLFYFDASYLPYEAWAVLVDRPNELLPDPKKKPSYVFKNDLYVGTTGEEVRRLQDCLVYFGCMKQEDVNTGYGNFGTLTRNGVMVFQERYGIEPVRGYFGSLSREKMNSLLSAG